MKSGWQSDITTFLATDAGNIQKSLEAYISDSSDSQKVAWRDSVRILQCEFRTLLKSDSSSNNFNVILEYKLPYEGRRPDAVILAKDIVFVLEFKGKESSDLADLDQVSAYTRDLKAYHRECHEKEVIPILVPTRASHKPVNRYGVQVV
ncbi:hypothetical protein OAF52_02090, partial [bacterium]|nr:hypothetical protein [bacterium]